MSQFRFDEDPDTREIRCSILPGPVAEITALRLRQAWDASDFAGCHLHTDRIDAAIKSAQEALAARRPPADAAAGSGSTEGIGAPGGGEEATPAPAPTPETLFTFVLAERRDGSCAVEVSDDRMRADAVAHAAAGGSPLQADAVHAALAAAGVVHGILAPDILELVAAIADARPGTSLRRAVARGTRPGPGEPSRFEKLVVPFQERVLVPQEREDGSVDFHELGGIETVTAGDALLRRHPARAGTEGCDVLGTTLPAIVPPETPIGVGDGTAIDPDDPHLLRATRCGVPHRMPNGMGVNNVLQVDAVDLHTGNIDFDGSLVVKSDIHSDMRVRVTGDVIVGGFIEAAEVEAGGDVTVRSGITGPAAQGSTHACRVKARSITAKHVQHAALEALEDVTVASNLMHSHVVGSRRVTAGGERNRTARICGGSVHATESITAGVFGAESETPTRIVMDDEVLRVRQESDAAHAQRMHLQETCAGLEHSLKELAHRPRTPVLTEKLARIANTIHAYHEELTRLDAADDARRERVASLVAGCRVVARAAIHPGLELQCLDARHHFSVVTGPMTLGVRDGNWTAIES